jgi:uncharacterized protein (TIGR01319 family)
MFETKIDSILAAECGSTTTTAALIELVDGHYQLAATGQATSTYSAPWNDITVGLQNATRHIEKTTGRTLLSPGGWPIVPQQPNNQGVDAFVVVSSAGPPLNVALAGLMNNISLTSARRAATTTYTHITTKLALDNDAANRRSSFEEQIQAIQTDPPDVILLAGGTDGGAERPVIEMANAVLMTLQVLSHADKPEFLFAGNKAAQDQVIEIIGEAANVKPVDNVRPTLEDENLSPTQIELENLYVQQKMQHLSGFDKLSQWSNYPPIPASRSFEKSIAYLGRQNHLNVLGAGIGSGATMVSAQAGDYQRSTIRSDAGVGHSLASLVKTIPVRQFHRWLPFDMPLEDLHNQLLNKALHPTSIPTTLEDLMIEYAVAREALRVTMAQARTGWPQHPITGQSDIRWNMVIGAGQTLTHALHRHHAAMIMLDALEPWGVTTLALDHNHLLNKLGAIAVVQPVAAVEITTRNFLLNLGTVVAPTGYGSDGQTALGVKIEFADGAVQELDIPFGEIQVIDLPPDQKATLEIRPARHLDIGIGQPGRSAVAEVEGGVLGIIIDARGRPLRLPRNDEQRQAKLRQWINSMAGEHQLLNRETDQ